MILLDTHIWIWCLAQKDRLTLELPVLDWIKLALAYPGVRLGSFHRDPVDRLLVVTAQSGDFNLMTLDTKILDYSHAPVWQ